MEILIRLIIEAFRASGNAKRNREAALRAQSRPVRTAPVAQARPTAARQPVGRRPAAPPPVRPGRRRAVPTTAVVAPPVMTPGPAPAVPPVKVAAVVAHEKPTQGSLFRKALTPTAMRRQIIVSELLQPPVALRA